MRAVFATALFAALCVSTVAATGTWTEIGTIDVVAVAMEFTNATHGYLAGGRNGGPTVGLFTTNDGGKTWTVTEVDNGDGLLALAIGVAQPSIVIGCVFGDYVSHNNGATFTADANGLMGQWIESENGNMYAIGQSLFGNTNGVAVSSDGASSFTQHNVSVLNTMARYGAFPSEKVWYVSAGEWPETNDDDGPSGGDDDMPNDDEPSLRGTGKKPTGTFQAQIAKTTDGGLTWKSQFYQTGEFYFNQIDCQDENTCCAVGESDETSKSNGVRIWCTTDGNTWNQVYFQAPPSADESYSLMAIQSLGDGEWMAGGTFGDAAFPHSTDGGKTWTLEKPSGGLAAVVDMSVPTDHVGFAIGVNQFNSMTLLKYDNTA